MGFSVVTTSRVRDFKIMLRRDKSEHEVTHMFDAHNSETFDPTEAVEVFVGDAMLTLQRGDQLVFLFE